MFDEMVGCADVGASGTAEPHLEELSSAQLAIVAELAAKADGCLVCHLVQNECALKMRGNVDVQPGGHFGYCAGQLFGWKRAAAPSASPDHGQDSPRAVTEDAAADPTESASTGAGQHAEAGQSSTTDTPAQASMSQLAPRVFVQSPRGRCVEFLRPGVYSAYTARHAGRQGVTELRSTAGALTEHRIIHHMTATTSTPAPLPIAEGTESQPPETIRAVQSLRVPQRLYPSITAGLVLPRIAAARPALKQGSGAILPPVLLMREFLVHAELSTEKIQAFEHIVAITEHALHAAASEGGDQVWQTCDCRGCGLKNPAYTLLRSLPTHSQQIFWHGHTAYAAHPALTDLRDT